VIIVKGALSSGATLLIVLVFAMMFIGMFYMVYSGYTVKPVTAYKGEWYQIYSPKYVAGTDLTIADTTIEENGVYYSANMSTNINETAGQTSYLAFGVRVKGTNGFKSAEIDGDLASGITTSEIQIRKAYIVPDEEGKVLDISDAVYTGKVDVSGDSFELTASPMPEGKYVVVTEVKGIDPSSISTGADLLKLTFSGDSEGDVTDFTLYIGNVNA